jgi:TRAP transporter TAXI family solute receptor
MDPKFCHWRRAAGCAALAILGLLSIAGPIIAQEARFFRIGTGATAGTFFEIGGVIASAISKPPGSPACDRGGICGVPGLVAVALATQGSVENLRLMASGQVESGFSQSDIASWAYAGNGMFADLGPMKRLRVIASLFAESFHLVVAAASPIRSLADIKGRHIALGELKSGTLADARLLLEALGLTEQQLRPEYLRPAQAAESLKDGNLDGFFMVGGFPFPAIRELAASTPVRLIPIGAEILAKLKEGRGYYMPGVIAAGTYRGIDSDTETIDMRALWVVSADAGEELVYQITRALWNETTRRLLDARNPVGRRIRLSDALDGISIPLHPGAERFYREAGLPVETLSVRRE